MVVISSGSTKFYKYVFPFIWFGIVAISLFVAMSTGARRQAPFAVVVPCILFVLGYVLFRRLLWVLADEVLDGGDFLVVRNRGEEITVYLSNIMNVSATTNMNPPQVTLRLVQPSKFGSEIVFSPKRSGFSLNPFRKNEIAEDLIARAYKARGARAR